MTPLMMERATTPIATGRKATATRMVIFQKTTPGPDSQTKCRTEGTFFSARSRSPQALPGGFCSSGCFSPCLAERSWSCLVEDIVHFGDAGAEKERIANTMRFQCQGRRKTSVTKQPATLEFFF